MKNILFIIIAFLAISCKAQNPIVGLDSPSYNATDGTYFKDLNNELDKFIGTWKFIDANDELIIEIEKKEQVPISNKYRDYLVGEYKYVKDGEELVNTLPNLNQNNVNENMGGGYILKPNEVPICNTCASDERRVDMYFKDPERKYLQSSIILRYIPNSSPPQMSVKIYSNDSVILPYDSAPTVMRVPYGEYLMIKQ